VRGLIEQHLKETGSPRAAWVLQNWYAMLPYFVKVFPHEYKRVLGVPRASETPRITLTRPVTQQEAVLR
jgi:glutamate synthase domain-containing protein 3